jgi:hypothetical protein
MARLFEALHERSNRAWLEIETSCDSADGLVVVFPQDAHHEILRVGEADLVQPRLIRATDSHECAIKAEAELAVERERKIIFQDGLPGWRYR